MDRTRTLAKWLLIAWLVCACSHEGPTGKLVEGQPCASPGATACGVTSDGTDAVLVCSSGESGVWTVAEACGGPCVLGPGGKYVCWGNEPDTGEELPGAEAQLDLLEGVDAPALNDLMELTERRDAETAKQELEFNDIVPDLTPPWVESTLPADGEMGVAIPFEVRITFTEPVHKPTVTPATVTMQDAGGKNLPIQLEFEGDGSKVLILKPQGAVFNSSPYAVTLAGKIRDLAGNEMGNSYHFTFYTAAIPALNYYRKLAGKFAPLIYQATNPEFPQYDYLTTFNLDGNWAAKDNVEYIKSSAVKVEPAVYYSVTETKSHYFITYAFFYPYRYGEDEKNRFGNDVSGAVVLIRKPDEMPIAAETWFSNELEDERSFSLVTDESGLVPGGKTFKDYHFDGSYPTSKLFPNGRLTLYLSARKHESCFWLLENTSLTEGCQLNAGIKASLKKIEYRYGNGNVTLIGKEGGKFPQAKEKVEFGLVHLLDSWWPRRGDVGQDRMWAETYEYEPHTSTVFKNRPELTFEIPSVFVDPSDNNQGRPPWAWAYQPGTGVTYYKMPRGVLFLDPAVYFKQRHDQGNTWPVFDPQTFSGWSLEYCFNPYFNLDFRGIWAECSPKQ